MKTRNKVFIGMGILLLVLVVSGYGWVSAYGPWGGPCGNDPHRFHGRGLHSDAHHKDMADYVLWRMDKKAGQMDLTAAQKAKYEAVRENFKSRLAEFHVDHRKMKDHFDKEISKENPDMESLIASAKMKVNDISGFMNKNIDLFKEFYSSLDNRQKTMINDEIRERMKYRRS
jgi:Spy/CpxP family protein refolding chaperone